MSYVNYDGVMVEDIWGKTYLISNCPFARMDLGEDHLSSVQDVIFGRQFLYKLQPEWQQDAVFRKLYLQAMPWCQKLSSLNTQQVVQAVIDFFISGKLLVWQFTDGWSKPPAGSPGIGGLAPLAGSGVAKATNTSSSASAIKLSNPESSSTALEPKTLSHDSAPVTQITQKTEPASLEEAVSILAARRQQIATQGYQQKYSDAELATKAQQGEVNDRFLLRLIFGDAAKAASGTLGFRRPSGRAPYWSTTFDMAEAADTDPNCWRPCLA